MVLLLEWVGQILRAVPERRHHDIVAAFLASATSAWQSTFRRVSIEVPTRIKLQAKSVGNSGF
jgi:hypothetical protein